MTLKQRLARIAALDLPDRKKRILRCLAWRMGGSHYCDKLPVHVVAESCEMMEETARKHLRDLFDLDLVGIYINPAHAHTYTLELPLVTPKRRAAP